MSKRDDYLQQYLQGPGPSPASDYLDDAPSKKKKTKKAKKKKEDAVLVKKRAGLQILDVDFESKVAAPQQQEEESEDELPEVEIDARLQEELAEEMARAKRRQMDPNEVGTWVDIGGSSLPRHQDDLSPPRRPEERDLSPPRRARLDSDDERPDLSPPRRPREAVGGDLSPPRRAVDLSPPRRARHDSDSDLSPPRRPMSRTVEADLSPPRRPIRRDDDDLSPPRRRPRGSPDLSPPRRPINSNRHDSDSDWSPPRRRLDTPPTSPKRPRRDDDGDLSPPRKRVKVEPTPVEISQPRSGLVLAKDVTAEMDAKRAREAVALKNRDPTSMGQGAATVYRDRHGRKLDMLNQMMRQQQGVFVDPDEEQMEWGKGKITKEELEEEERRRRRQIEEAGAPYRAYSAEHDPEVKMKQLERDRWGDPMLALLAKKRREEEAEAKRRRPQWNGPFPPNRFNIKPGHLWDGVDRSNGFEKKHFERLNETAAHKQMAYQWAAADM